MSEWEAMQLLRDKGLCGVVRDGQACILNAEHPGPHGWEETNGVTTTHEERAREWCAKHPYPAYQQDQDALAAEFAAVERETEARVLREIAERLRRRAGELRGGPTPCGMFLLMEADAIECGERRAK